MTTQLLHQRPETALDWQFDPPAEVLQSRLFAAGGYLVVRGLFDEETLQDLREEAEHVRIEAERMLVAESDGTEGRGGFPARAYRSGPGRDLHWGLHGCQQMAETLASVCGLGVSASGRGTYSYYEQTGDFLAVHRDVLAVRYRRHHVAHQVQDGLPSWRVGRLSRFHSRTAVHGSRGGEKRGNFGAARSRAHHDSAGWDPAP